MERNLKETLQKLLNEFNANFIDEYFCNGSFLEDCEKMFEVNSTERELEVIEYLTSKFYDIDIDYRDTDKFEEIVKQTIEEAINMLEVK